MSKKTTFPMSTTITVYVTKYAISRGIVRCRAEYDPQYPRMVKTKTQPQYLFHGEGKDWHRTIEGAVERAEELRVAALEAANNRIKKLSAMTFTMFDVKDDFNYLRTPGTDDQEY